MHAICPIERGMFLRFFPLSDVEEGNLLKMGVSLNQMACTPEGAFDWNFITAAHFSVTDEPRRTISDKCSQKSCVIYKITLQLVDQLLSDYHFYFKRLSLMRKCDPLAQLKSLIQLELELLTKTKESWKDVCQVL